MKSKTTSIDDYIKTFPQEVQSILNKIRHLTKELAPEAEEAICYGIPTFKLSGNLVHFAAYKNHIGFYPTPSGIEVFRSRLVDYKVTKGAIQFPITAPIPYGLMKEIIVFRLSEIKLKKNESKIRK
ncbi:MAG: DUF1801 domain-containing protein [Oligoflexia bacterium]|nr:DUF1801 domain-containing protein [Oligoflexia bacterium]